MEPLPASIQDIDQIYVAMQFEINQFKRWLQLARLSPQLINTTENMPFLGLLLDVIEGDKKPPLPLRKIRYSYPIMMKTGTVLPLLKNIKNYKNYLRQPLSYVDISIFHEEFLNFCYIEK